MAWTFNPFTGNLDYFTAAGGTNQLRVQTLPDATSVTFGTASYDMGVQANTQAAAGTLTINAPTGTPVDGQRYIFRVSSTNSQILAWNAVFQFSTDIPQPSATSGGGKWDYFSFMYNSTAGKWQLVSNIMGFA